MAGACDQIGAAQTLLIIWEPVSAAVGWESRVRVGFAS
jgi:hypothetical protein